MSQPEVARQFRRCLRLGDVNMKTDRGAAALAAADLTACMLAWWTVPASARCARVLGAGWQYHTECNNTGGGGGGGTDYSGAIGAGIGLGVMAIEMLPGLLNTVGEVAGGVADLGSGVVNGVGDAAGGVMQAGASATDSLADTGATSFNTFIIFAPQRDVPCTEADRKRGCRNIHGNAAGFSGNSSGDEQYVVDPGGCSANKAVRGGCPKMEPRVTCNDRGCYTEYVKVPPPPKKRKTARKNGKQRIR
jgi:hypothetical protein